MKITNLIEKINHSINGFYSLAQDVSNESRKKAIELKLKGLFTQLSLFGESINKQAVNNYVKAAKDPKSSPEERKLLERFRDDSVELQQYLIELSLLINHFMNTGAGFSEIKNVLRGIINKFGSFDTDEEDDEDIFEMSDEELLNPSNEKEIDENEETKKNVTRMAESVESDLNEAIALKVLIRNKERDKYVPELLKEQINEARSELSDGKKNVEEKEIARIDKDVLFKSKLTEIIGLATAFTKEKNQSLYDVYKKKLEEFTKNELASNDPDDEDLIDNASAKLAELNDQVESVPKDTITTDRVNPEVLKNIKDKVEVVKLKALEKTDVMEQGGGVSKWDKADTAKSRMGVELDREPAWKQIEEKEYYESVLKQLTDPEERATIEKLIDSTNDIILFIQSNSDMAENSQALTDARKIFLKKRNSDVEKQKALNLMQTLVKATREFRSEIKRLRYKKELLISASKFIFAKLQIQKNKRDIESGDVDVKEMWVKKLENENKELLLRSGKSAKLTNTYPIVKARKDLITKILDRDDFYKLTEEQIQEEYDKTILPLNDKIKARSRDAVAVRGRGTALEFAGRAKQQFIELKANYAVFGDIAHELFMIKMANDPRFGNTLAHVAALKQEIIDLRVAQKTYPEKSAQNTAIKNKLAVLNKQLLEKANYKAYLSVALEVFDQNPDSPGTKKLLGLIKDDRGNKLSQAICQYIEKGIGEKDQIMENFKILFNILNDPDLNSKSIGEGNVKRIKTNEASILNNLKKAYTMLFNDMPLPETTSEEQEGNTNEEA